MAQQLKACTVLAEDLSPVSNIYLLMSLPQLKLQGI